MSFADLRVYECRSSAGPNGSPVLDAVHFISRRKIDVALTDVLVANALSVPLRAPLAYNVYLNERRLLLSYLVADPKGDFALRRDEFRASASHIRRFVTESLGLGMLTAGVHEVYGWKVTHAGVNHFDALPLHFVDRFDKTGTRPDLLYPISSGLAGEARGRSTKQARAARPTQAQRDRLEQLLSWSDRHGGHPVAMSWAHTGGHRVAIDFFRFTGPAGPGRQNAFSDTPSLALALNPAEERAAVAMDQLYATAPESRQVGQFGDIRLRGRWVPLDLITPTPTQLLIGVLEHWPESRTRTRWGEHSAERPITVAVDGRLVMVVAHRYDEAPRWDLVVDWDQYR